MVVCRNWTGVPGSCRFGERCRFDHPEPNRGSIRSSNPFSPLQSTNPNLRNNSGYQAGVSTTPSLPFNLDKEQIVTDLSSERPQWILSAYGPGRFAPEQLFGGPVREQSFEEIHLLQRIAERQENIQQAAQEAQKLFQQSEQQIQTALNNVDGAIEYILNAENNHPNRLDIIKNSMSGILQNTNTFAFGRNSRATQALPPTSGTFGAPSQPGASSALGASSMISSSGAFGRPSALGAQSGAFGAPSQLGAGGGAFGQPSALGQKPNPFWAPSGGTSSGFAQPESAFGKPSQPTTSSAFGAPSQPVPSNPFGAPSQPALSGAFGAPSQSTPSNPFGTPSQAANPFVGVSSTPFGGASPARPNPFGAPSQPAASSPFGAPTGQTAASNPFEAPSQLAKPNSFGGASAQDFRSTTRAAANPIGSAQPKPPAPTNPFSAPSNGQTFANSESMPTSDLDSYKPTSSIDSELRHPPLSSYATHVNGRLAAWKGRPAVYRNGHPGFIANDGMWERIWFPDGPPPPNPDAEMPDEMYDEETKQAYLHHRRTGRFPNGKIPFLPPKQEWLLWDL